MKSFPSIETVYKRGDDGKLDVSTFRIPAVSAITDWTVSEKIDGMNMRVIYRFDDNGEPMMTIRGRTDNANIPGDLIDHIDTVMPSPDEAVTYFTEYRGKELHPEWSVTFYGEGYGGSIQKGSRYSEKKKFRCFDLLLGESWWTDDSEMRRVAAELHVPVAPWLGIWSWDGSRRIGARLLPYDYDTLAEVIPYSITAYQDRGVRDVEAEGIVVKPRVQLFDTRGERVVWKLTFREFPRDAPERVGAAAGGRA